MATTKIWAIKERVEDAIKYISDKGKTFNEKYKEHKKEVEVLRTSEYDIYYNDPNPNIYNDFDVSFDYATNPEKTEQQYFVTGINCISEIAKEEMRITKNQYGKTDRILGFHATQSFKGKEAPPEIIHEIGVRLANELWGDRFEVVVSTHLNTENYHNHFIINSVSFVDGMKYYDNYTTYAHFREVSDELCREYNLSVLKERPCKKSKLDFRNFQKKYHNSNYYITTQEDIDKAIRQAYSYDDFENILNKMGYTITYRAEKISVCRDGYKRNIRIERSFGEEYTIDRIKERILEEDEIRVPFHEVYARKRFHSKRSYKQIQQLDKKFHSSLYRLYLYYRYKINSYSKSEKRTPLTKEKREALKKMDMYSEQAKFLVSKKINTKEELFSYKLTLLVEIDNLYADYKKILRVKGSNEDKEKILSKIKSLNEEVEMCKSIEERIPKMKEEINEIDKEEELRKESVKDERIR